MTLESIMEFYSVKDYHYNFVTSTLEIYEELPVKYFLDIRNALRQIGFRLNNIIVGGRE